MHGPEIREAALALLEQGMNDCEVARRLGLSRTTVPDWRRPPYVPRRPTMPPETCPRCWGVCTPITFTPEDYAELLGL